MRRFWIIGGGRFGLRAAEALRRMASGAELLIVEKNRSRCETLQAMDLPAICGDGIDFLSRGLEGPGQRVWIVAAAPVHVAYEWVRARLSETSRFEPYELPADAARLLPNAMAGAAGQMFASNAHFICPPDCSEAGRLCTATGRPRPRRMHAFLRDLPCPGVKKIIVRSFQLAAGVGALRASDLFSALEDVRASETPILFATACKCHGVMNSFRVIR